MTIFKIKAPALRAEGFRFETASRKSAEKKLAEVVKRDPAAKIIALPAVR